MSRLIVTTLLRLSCLIGFVYGQCTTVNECDTDNILTLPGDATAGELTFSTAGGECVPNAGVVTATCSGYIAVTTYTCTDGAWRPSAAVCYGASGCPTPEAPENGYIEGDNYALFQSIMYVCSDSYSIVGADSARCSETGEWSQSPPQCLASCERPLTNGTVTYTPDNALYANGEVVQFSCDPDSTTMSGPTAATCRDGTWEPSPPSCYAKCTITASDTVSITDPNSAGDVVDHLTTIDFSCALDRYINDGEMVGSTTCRDGLWSVTVYCSASCSLNTLTVPDNVYVNMSEEILYDGDMLLFRCRVGLPVNPSAGALCSDGVWETDAIECVEPEYVDCPDPGSPVNGEAVGTNFTHGASVTFSCNENYSLSGASSITCDNGTWSGEAPTCVENTDGGGENRSVQLECREDSIVVTIDKSSLPDLNGDVLILEGDSSCAGVETDDYITFTTRFDACGTTKEADGEFDVYRNRVINQANLGGVVSRDLTVSLPITCNYERVYHLDYGYSVSGSPLLFQESLVGSYSVDFDIAMFTDDTFTNPADDIGAEVGVGQRAFFAITSTTSGSEEVVIDSCWATPSSDPDDDTRYDLITDRCQLEDTVMNHDLGSTSRVGFSFNGFTFLDGTEIFLYCDVVLCSASSDPQPECADCSARRRRAAASAGSPGEQMHHLSVGPVRVVRATRGRHGSLNMAAQLPGDQVKARQDATPWMTAVAIMTVAIVGLIITVAVLARRSRRDSTRFD